MKACSLDLLPITSFTQVEDFATRPSHLDTYSIKCRSTYIHGCHGDFQRGTSVSWYVSVDIRTRAGGSQSALTVVLLYSSLCGAPDSVGGEGAGKKTAAICTGMMGGVVWVVLRCKDNPLAALHANSVNIPPC